MGHKLSKSRCVKRVVLASVEFSLSIVSLAQSGDQEKFSSDRNMRRLAMSFFRRLDLKP